MGLAGARNSAVTGLQAQSTNIAITSDNIANASTVGYKAVKGAFSTLITSTGDSTSFSSGGVSITPETLISQQGLIESTGNATDLAISGSGFFAVQDASGTLLLTRAGSFNVNNKGELTNSAGFKLLGWPLDNDGRRPGELGNTNTTAAESIDSLVIVDTDSASGAASPTTTIKIGMNLDAGQTVFQGATVTLDPVSTANALIAEGDIIVPATGMQEGDQLTFTSNSSSTTFTYGGFAKSKNIVSSVTYGATSASTTFTTTGGDLAEGDQFTINTISSGTVTFTFKQSSPDTSNGQFNSLNTLATAINSSNGLTARVSNGVLYVSSDIATEAVTFADVSSSSMVAELGLSNEAAAAGGVNRFNTMLGLETLVNEQTQLGATVNNPTSAATIDIYSSDPLQTLTLTKVKSSLTIDLQSDNNGTNTPTALIVPVETDGVSTMIPDTTGLIANAQSAATISFSDLGVPVAVGGGNADDNTFIYGGIASTKNISAGIFGATTSSGTFAAGGGLADEEILTFSDGVSSVAVSFETGALAAGDFNSLDTLATAISRTGTFNARVANGVLYVASVALPDAVMNVTSTTAMTGAQMVTAFGGSWTDAGGQVARPVTAVTTGLKRFNTLSQLDALIEGITTTNLMTTVAPTGTNGTIGITTTTANAQITIGGVNNADLLNELGITSGTVSNGMFTEFGIDDLIADTVSTDAAAAATATVAVTYNPDDSTKNMAGGNITADFSRNIRVFDALGTGHDFRMSYLKTGTNQWAMEFYAIDDTEISNDSSGDGLLVAGTITFNGDGSLASVESTLTGEIDIGWTNGSSTTTFEFDLGTAGLPSGTVGANVIGLTDGIRQFDSAYNVDFVEQNGVAAGQFSGITVDEDGVVAAKFSNGQIKAIYKIPVVTVANPNALSQKTGNVFSVTSASGDVNLKQAGLGGSGVIVPNSLEGSTADIASELTKTIGIQSNYNANATLISTVKAMEEELNRRL